MACYFALYERTKNPYLYAMLLDEEIEAFNKANPDRMFHDSPAYAAFDKHLGTLFSFGNEAEQEKMTLFKQNAQKQQYNVQKNANVAKNEPKNNKKAEVKTQLKH